MPKDRKLMIVELTYTQSGSCSFCLVGRGVFVITAMNGEGVKVYLCADCRGEIAAHG